MINPSGDLAVILTVPGGLLCDFLFAIHPG